MTDPVRQAEQALRDEFHSLDLARSAFPMLTDWGVEDFSHTTHSLGCNYLTEIGREAGFWAMSEYPVRVPSASAQHSVRTDVAWWERPSGDAVVLGEFERAEPRRPGKLLEKAENLLRAHNALGDRPRLLLLVGWALAGTNFGDLGAVRAVMASGFRASDGTPIRGISRCSAFLLATAVFGDVGRGLKLLRVLT